MTDGDSAQRRDVVCPLCGYETVLFETGDAYCPDCFASSSGPAQRVLRRTLKLRENPPVDPVTETLKEAVEMVANTAPSLSDQIVIATSDRIKREVIVENERFVSSPLDLTASFSLNGSPVITTDKMDRREAKVYTDSGDNFAEALGQTISSVQQVQFPEVMLDDE